MEKLSHSRQPNKSSASHSKKSCNATNLLTKTTYDDVFGGPPKFAAPTLAPRVEDYGEIFGGFQNSRATSIPVLDLPLVDEEDVFFDVRSSGFDYDEVFGGYDDLDSAVSFEELIMEQNDGVTGDVDSSEEAWTPPETESLSEESDHSGKNHSLSNGDSYESIDDTMEFNISYHKANQRSDEDMSNGITHVTQLQAVPGFTFLVEKTNPLEKAHENPPLQVTDENNFHMDFSGGMIKDKNLRKTMSQPFSGSAGEQTFENGLKSQRGYGRNNSLHNETFVTVSEISLRTQPSEVPPPRRPAPLLDVKKGDSSSMAKNCKTTSEGTVGDTSPPFFDVEVDASSSAAASAAAMKEVMEKAEARLKTAKELLERKRVGVQRRKNGRKDMEGKLYANIDGSSYLKDEDLCVTLERQDIGMKQKGIKTTKAVPDSVEGEKFFMFDKGLLDKHGQPDRIDGASEWKEETQFFELVKTDRSTVEQAKSQEILVPDTQVHEHRPKIKKGANSEDPKPGENERKLKVAKEACEQQERNERSSSKATRKHKGHDKKPKVAQEVCQQGENGKKFVVARDFIDIEKKPSGADESEKHLNLAKLQIKGNPSDCQKGIKHQEFEQPLKETKRSVEKETSFKGSCERADDERRQRESFEQVENENKFKQDVEQVEYEKRLKKALEQEEKDKRKKVAEQEEKDRRLKKVAEQEEKDRRLKKVAEQEENDKKWKEAQKREEADKRAREALEQIENEKRLKEENEKRTQAFDREEKARRLKEVCEQEENEKKQRQAPEIGGNEKSFKEAPEKEENERKQGGASEREETEKRLQEACEVEKKEKRLENAGDTADLKGLSEAHEQTQWDENCKKLKMAGGPHLYMEGEVLRVSDKAFMLNNNENIQATQPTGLREESSSTVQVTQRTFVHGENVKIQTDCRDHEMELEVETTNVLKNRKFELSGTAQGNLEHEECGFKKEDVVEPLCKEQNVKTGESGGGIGTEKTNSVFQVDSDTKNEGKKFANERRERENNVKQAQVGLNQKENKDKFMPTQLVKESVQNGRKLEADQPSVLEGKGNVQKTAQWANAIKSAERKEKNFHETLILEEKEVEKLKRERELEKEHLRRIEEERERELEKERLRRIEEEREREREREKDRMAVDIAILEARGRAERSALERATAEARQRALAEARERLEKACAEAKEKSLAEKASMEARLRAERAAVERATAEARERAVEKAMADRAAFEARERGTFPDKLSASSRHSTLRPISSNDLQDQKYQSANFSGSRYPYSSAYVASYNTERSEGTECETAQRCKARLERHRRTAERAAKALAEKNMRDLLAQREQAERNRLAETLDADVKRWSSGKEGNLRALLSTLQYILGPDSGWHPIPLTEVITSAAVKKAYRKATLCVHPDKLQQRGASIQQKYICEKVFDLLKEAWNKFNSEER
ncbi:auxilin-like protein 1 isoform X2 [Pistacia vera]|uniref:auxilin-like protein 1 isoform X2 n=1 Tax=Pistacia vera TaxID=55513 RepID=UPI001263CCAD|nr:auxilin-like protein 1 isoform X2 [Pistacia vera]